MLPREEKITYARYATLEGCRGFKIGLGPVVGRERAATLQAGRDFEPATLNPYTVQCDHNPCDFSVEAKYTVLKGIACGVLGDSDAVAPSAVIETQGWRIKLEGKTLAERKAITCNQGEWPLGHTDILWNPMFLDNWNGSEDSRFQSWGKKLWNGEPYMHIKCSDPTTQYFNFSLSGELRPLFEKVSHFLFIFFIISFILAICNKYVPQT